MTEEEKHEHQSPSYDVEASLAVVDQFFSPCRRSVAKHCTFGDPRRKTRLDDSHIRKVSRYARRRLEKMNWNFLENESVTLPKGEVHDNVELGGILGEGSFSTVFIKKQQPDHVVKVLRKKLINDPAMLSACAADLVKEGILLSVLAGESNVVQISAWQKNGLSTLTNGLHDGFFLVLERLEFTLGDKLKKWEKQKSKFSNPFHLRKKGGISSGLTKTKLLEERLMVVPQLARGIANLHKHGIIHRDLKPDNIGFANGQWKIFDLDVARLCPTFSPNDYWETGFLLTKRVGSPRYMAPETARGDSYNCQADVYSFALLVHEILTLEKPYDNIPVELHDELVFYQHTRPHFSNQWPISLKKFLDSSWHRDWEKRPVLLDDGIHSYISNCIVPEFLDYKKEKYGTYKSKGSGFFSKKEKPKSVIPATVMADLETSFSTQLTSSMRRDSISFSPVLGS
jgi:serine/threonine protein kinase